MSTKLLAVTYDNDLPQFKLMCYCLNKNWVGNRDITIIYGKNENENTQSDIGSEVKHICNQQFDSSWDIEIHHGIKTQMSGHHEQQLHKVLHSMDDRYEDVIVFDAKDFMLKPGNESDFKHNGKYNLAYMDTTQKLDDIYTEIHLAFPDLNTNIPPVHVLTPWIWNTKQMHRVWDYVTSIYGTNYSDWTEFPGAWEWAVHYAFTQNDIDRIADYITPDPSNKFVITGGVWNGQTLGGAEAQYHEFSKYNERKYWKHTRKTIGNHFIAITSMLLQDFDIPANIIVDWAYENGKINLPSYLVTNVIDGKYI